MRTCLAVSRHHRPTVDSWAGCFSSRLPGQGAQLVGAGQGVGSAARAIGGFTPTAPLPGGPATTAQPAPQLAPPQQQNPIQPTPIDPLLKPLGYHRGGTVSVFDQGGWLHPGELAINKTKQVEPMPVFNASQWNSLNKIANQEVAPLDPKSMGGGDDFRIILENVTVGNADELRRKLDDYQTLRPMRHRDGRDQPSLWPGFGSLGTPR